MDDAISACADSGPFPCVEDGCPRAELSCYFLAKHMDACLEQFSSMWSSAPPGFEQAFRKTVGQECAASCGTCSNARLRATAAYTEPSPWSHRSVVAVERIPGNASNERLAARVRAASELGPFIITDALGATFRAEEWTRPALHARCSPSAGSPPPAPPWPTIAYREPAAVGKRWAGLRFENGASLGVRDVPSLIDAQDSGRLAGMVLFDSPANHTCPPMLRRSAADTMPNALPAPRFFPRDFEVALGGPKGEGLWRKGGAPWDDPDIFVSKRGTRTHVHIDSHCTRFWMMQLNGRKLWRLMPPSEVANLAPAADAKGGEHFLADVLSPDAELNVDVGARLADIERVHEFVLSPGELAFIPERWAHAVHNLDDTIAMTYNFVDEANLPCYLESLWPHTTRLLRKLLSQLAQGRGAADAASAFARHPPLAYFAHLERRVSPS